MAKTYTTLKTKRLFLGVDSGGRMTEVTATADELNKLDGAVLDIGDVTATAAEVNLLDNAQLENDYAGAAVIMDSANYIQTSTNVGSKNASTTVTEYGDGWNHLTRLVVTALPMPNVPGADTEAVGVLLYTFPATGDIIIKNATYDAFVTINGTGNSAKTPEFALGSVIATGDSATTDGTATFEDIMTGTAGSADGSTAVELTLAQSVVLAKGATNKVHFNMADTWAAASTATSVTGVFFIEWSIRII